jgi:hypothetical protein
MRYMLMMHVPRGTGEYQISSWSQKDLEAHIAFMHNLNKELTDAGELVGAEGLTPPGEARVVRAGKNGLPAVTDGSRRRRSSSPGSGSWTWTAPSARTRSRRRPRPRRDPVARR